MDIQHVRSLFPGTQGRAFLDAACVSLMPTPAQSALTQLGKDLVTCPARDASSHHIALDMTAEIPRREIARLINTRIEDIALVESTTHGLEVIANVVPLTKGDRVLVGETEFLGLAVPWIGRRAAQGFQIVTVPHRQGRMYVEDFASCIDERTRMILLSSVQWNNGFRANLAGFSQLARDRGITLVVDAIQQLGAIPIDVQATPMDFLVCGGHKWLNAPAGRGFLYVHPTWQQRANVCPRGYLHIEQPPEGWAEYFATPSIPAVRDYDFVSDARAFELGGTANYPGNVVLGASVKLINDIGPGKIAEHVIALGERLIQSLDQLGVKVISPRERESRSGIVSFTLGKGVDHDRAFLSKLWDQNVIISHRYTANVGGLRVSIHLFNNQDDIEQLIAAVNRAR